METCNNCAMGMTEFKFCDRHAPKQKIIQVRDVKGRDWTRHGVKHEGKHDVGHHLDICPGRWVRVHGEGERYVPGQGGVSVQRVPYNTVFEIGDFAVYGGYNLTYTGRIIAIGAKSITIEHGGQKTRLDLERFSHENRFFDLAEIRERNAAWMD